MFECVENHSSQMRAESSREKHDITALNMTPVSEDMDPLEGQTMTVRDVEHRLDCSREEAWEEIEDRDPIGYRDVAGPRSPDAVVDEVVRDPGIRWKL